MDPRRVLTFRAVAHERSFSAAARALALTQPAVSQQVAALERELGARLLDREPGGLTLTPAGAMPLGHDGALADRLELAGTQLVELAAAERSRLRIGAFPSALAALVPKAVVRLGASEVLVEEGSTPALAERVRRGEVPPGGGLPGAARARGGGGHRARRAGRRRPLPRAVLGGAVARPPACGARGRAAGEPQRPAVG